MITKILGLAAGLLVAITVGFAGTVSKSDGCCYEGSPCCFEGSPCCEAAAAPKRDCCVELAPCCAGSACCK